MTNQADDNKVADAIGNKTILYVGGGLIIAAIIGILAIYSMKFLNPTGTATPYQAYSMTNMNGTGKALMLYYYANDDKLPPRIETLVIDGYASKKMFTHPKNDYRLEIIDGEFDSNPDYVYFLDFPMDDKTKTIRGYEKTMYEKNGQVCVLLNSGVVTRMDIADLDAQLKAEGRGPAE